MGTAEYQPVHDYPADGSEPIWRLDYPAVPAAVLGARVHRLRTLRDDTTALFGFGRAAAEELAWLEAELAGRGGAS